MTSVPYARPAEVLTPEALHQWAEVDGLKFGEIARRTGFDPKTVKRYLSAAGIVPPPKAPPTPRVDGRRMLRTHPEVDEAVLRELYERQALSVTEVAIRTGLHQATVSRRLARYGIPTRRPSPTPPSNPYERPAEILTRDLLERLAVHDGLTAEEIARRSGFSPATVIRYLRAANLPVRSRNPVTYHIDPDDLAELRGHGWSQERIAERYGCQASTVGRALRRAGLPTGRVDQKLTPK